MTCFNRREETLRCLDAISSQAGLALLKVSIFLVDDASTDGTASAVRNRFPEVNVISGMGNLFWNRGMRMAFDEARKCDFDAYLWLNDDTMLSPDALSTLLSAWKDLQREGTDAIVTGSTFDRISGRRTYGGFRWTGKWRRTLIPVEPSHIPVACDTMNGNCTLIPRRVSEAVGNLDPSFHHSFGDMDYGFRARAQGFKRRWRHLNSPKGSPFPEWRLYCSRHLGPLWPLYAVSPYLKTLATAISGPKPEVDAA